MDIIIFISNDFSSWADQRGNRPKEMCEEKGLKLRVSHSQHYLEITAILRAQSPKVVLNELWHIRSHVLIQLAQEFPNINFVNVEHQSTSFTLEIDMHSHYSEKERLRRLAQEWPNVYCATVMRKELFPEGFLELPNLVNYWPRSERKSNNFVLSIISRYDKLKNISGQIQAVCHYSKQNDVSLLILSHHLHLIQRDVRYLVEHKVPFRVLPWQNWAIYMNMVDNFVDVGLQCSLTESFNQVGVEHMMMGKPVVGTDAIEYLPEHWKVPAHDVIKISNKIGELRALDNEKTLARDVALKVQERNAKVFFETINSLMI